MNGSSAVRRDTEPIHLTPEDEPPLRVGRDLRRERERRGVALEEVARGTKFSVRHLQSLEADLVDELPGGVLRKGILRSYCRHLGLDGEAWVARFTAEGGLEGTELNLTEFAENVHRTRLESTPPVRDRWWAVLGMLLLFLALAFAAWHYVIQPKTGFHSHPTQPIVSGRSS